MEVKEQNKLLDELLQGYENPCNISPEAASWLLENYQKLDEKFPINSPVFRKFYCEEDDHFTGIENSSGEAFVESFFTLEGVTFWLNNDHLENSIAKDYDLECAWNELEDVPFDEVDSVLCLVVDWKGFEAGTTRNDIWEYFDTYYSKGVYHLLYEYEKGLNSIDLGIK